MLNKLRILLARKRLEKQFRGDKPSYFGQQLKQYKWLKPKYILGYLTLFIVLILQGNDQWISSYITSLRYRPTPAIIESPWPWEKNATIHQLISNMNSGQETDIKSVANYIKTNELDPYLRIKAVHDYVISRVTYDRDVLETGIRPSQEAKEVFKTGKAVCEGYAKLFQAIAKEMGEEVAYIEGDIRREFAPDDVIPQYLKWSDPLYDWTRHAWNGVKIDNNWYLVDTTWDDSGREYNATYLMPNEKVMNISHLPDQAVWQLSYQPHSPQAFEKQALLNPDFFKQGLELLSPIQYNNEVEKTGKIKLRNENHSLQILGIFKKTESHKLLNLGKQEVANEYQPCESQKSNPEESTISCPFPTPGVYQVLMLSFDQDKKYQGQPKKLGTIKFTVKS